MLRVCWINFISQYINVSVSVKEELHELIEPRTSLNLYSQDSVRKLQHSVASMSQHYKKKYEVNMRNDLDTIDRLYRETDALEADNSVLKDMNQGLQKSNQAYRETMHNLINVTDSATETLRQMKTKDNPHFFKSELSLMEELRQDLAGKYSDQVQEDIFLLHDHFRTLLKEVGRFSAENLDGADNNTSKHPSLGIIGKLKEVTDCLKSIREGSGEIKRENVHDMLSNLSREINNVLNEKKHFEREVTSLCRDVFDIFKLDRKREQREDMLRILDEEKQTAGRKGQRMSRTIATIHKDEIDEKQELDKINDDLNRTIKRANAKRQRVVQRLPEDRKRQAGSVPDDYIPPQTKEIQTDTSMLPVHSEVWTITEEGGRLQPKTVQKVSENITKSNAASQKPWRANSRLYQTRSERQKEVAKKPLIRPDIKLDPEYEEKERSDETREEEMNKQLAGGDGNIDRAVKPYEITAGKKQPNQREMINRTNHQNNFGNPRGDAAKPPKKGRAPRGHETLGPALTVKPLM